MYLFLLPPEPGYVATSAMLVQSALCLLDEKDSLPSRLVAWKGRWGGGGGSLIANRVWLINLIMNVTSYVTVSFITVVLYCILLESYQNMFHARMHEHTHTHTHTHTYTHTHTQWRDLHSSCGIWQHQPDQELGEHWQSQVWGGAELIGCHNYVQLCCVVWFLTAFFNMCVLF